MKENKTSEELLKREWFEFEQLYFGPSSIPDCQQHSGADKLRSCDHPCWNGASGGTFSPTFSLSSSS